MLYSFPLLLLRKLVLLPSYILVLVVRLLKWSIAPLALLLQVLIGVPMALWRFKQPLKPRFISLRPTDLPDLAWITFTDTNEALAAEGFTCCGDFRCDELIQEATIWLRLSVQPELGIAALMAHIEFKTGTRSIRQFVEFGTEFCDGRVLTTNNLDIPYSLPAPAYMARLQLKDIWEPRALLALHRGLLASLSQPIKRREHLEHAFHDSGSPLLASFTREINALIEAGWLRPSPDRSQVKLRPWAALIGVWRQAWPLQSLYLRAADRRSRHLLAQHGLEVEQFMGGATTILVSQQVPATSRTIAGVVSGYQHIQSLINQQAPNARLETVAVELEHDPATEALIAREFRYSFRSHQDHAQRRIRRFHSFDILLDPTTGASAVTAAEREYEQATDDEEWEELTASLPCEPLRLNSWLHDLDRVLPVAQAALAQRTSVTSPMLDSALLYLDEGALRWQVVAWTDQNKPFVVTLDARSGVVL